MTSDWGRVEELFARAVELATDERGAFLDRECGDDPALRGQVEELLKCDSRDASPISDAIGRAAAEVNAEKAASESSAQEGRSIGPYRVERLIGRGGMGVVYLASRDEPYRQQVAIKVMSRDLAGADELRRFRGERQILASLNHPNVSRLLDGGTTDQGSPYLVMEYVEGVPIDRYCDDHALGTRARLELFCTVCEAIQFAHQNLVVHRDIKPSNILVDSSGTPKLLDFGIAKLLDPGLIDRSVAVTAASSRLLTPEYASPEQLRGEPITTATDVYSLGVLLYKLLTGQRPYRVQSDQLWELGRAICEQDPDPPSTAVTRPDAGVAQPERLRRQLLGDLDNILLKALQKAPADRYGSPAEFAQDVQRQLASEPVMAASPSAAYRFAKFVRRNRLGVAAAAIVVTALVGGATAAGVGLVRARAAEAEALREAESSKEIADFLVDLFRVSDPGRARGNDITAREILDRGAQRLNEELAGQPLVQARMMETIGEVYSGLGLYDPANELVEKALANRQERQGSEHPDTLIAMSAMGRLRNAQGRYREAEKILADVRERAVDVLGADHPETLLASAWLGDILRRQGRYEDAEPVLLDTLERRRTLHGEEDPRTLQSMRLLGDLYRRTGDYPRARELYEKAAAGQEKVLGPDSPATLNTQNNLATVASFQGELDEAERLYRHVIEQQTRVLGPRSRNTLATQNNLAGVLDQRGRYEEASAQYEQLAQIFREELGPDHPSTLVVRYNLASTLTNMERYGEAEEILADVYDAQARTLGSDHPDTLDSLLELAAGSARRERWSEAIDRLERAVETGMDDAERLDHPSFQPIEDRPRFKALVERLSS